MSTASVAQTMPSTGLVAQPVSTRVLSLDIFRGFAMAVMIFVNDLGEVHGLSRWTYHIPRNIDAMSYVDMVYPFFLFAVGLSLPLAIRQRLRRDPSVLHLWGHILLRCFALLVLGLILANASSTSREFTHMRGSLWAILSLLGAILLWAVYPDRVPRRLTQVLRGIGIVLLVTMLALFRRKLASGQPGWIDFSYPEILGLIGLTYLAVCLLYIPTRRFTWAPLAWFVALVLLNIGICAHRLPYPQPMYLFPWDNGAMPSITMAGIVVSAIFLSDRLRATPSRQFAYALGFAVVCAVLGLLLRPLGISKIRATPTWALWSIAAATAVFALFYWLLDRRHHTAWAYPLPSPRRQHPTHVPHPRPHVLPPRHSRTHTRPYSLQRRPPRHHPRRCLHRSDASSLPRRHKGSPPPPALARAHAGCPIFATASSSLRWAAPDAPSSRRLHRG